jgi:hypothetical protein
VYVVNHAAPSLVAGGTEQSTKAAPDQVLHVVAAKAQVLETCTLIGCESASASFSIQRLDGKPPSFVVKVEVDGKVTTCQPTKTSGWGALPETCGENVSIIVREVVECVTTKTGEGSYHQDCPRSGQFEEYVHIHGDPERVTISLVQGGREVAERVFFPEYKLDYPNGPRCGDPCKFWDTTWII